MSPMAMYEERRLHAKRRFEMDADAIRVSGSTILTEVDTTIPLIRLDPAFARVWVYSLFFHVGYWLLLLGITLLLIVATITMAQDDRAFTGKALGPAGFLS